MYANEIDQIDLKYPDIMVMETGAQGMYVLYDDNRDSIAVTGQAGMVRLSIDQLRVLIELGPDILDQLRYRA